MNHTHLLTRTELSAIPAGRFLDTLVHEYIFNERPERWCNSSQEFVPHKWFEELPRACAEDDGGTCPADWLLSYSGKDWETVVDRMSADGYEVSLSRNTEGEWTAAFTRGGNPPVWMRCCSFKSVNQGRAVCAAALLTKSGNR